MAYYDTYNNVQFLDLSGVDEEEKKWILTSLQGCYPCVKGPWTKKTDETTQTSEAETTHANLNNGLAAMPYEPYPTTPVIISTHVSPISSQVYPQSYHQTPIQMYPPPPFVSQVSYAPPMMSVVPAMVPVNASIMPVPIANNAPPPYCQPVVTYATYPPPMQTTPIYNAVATECTTKMNANHPYNCPEALQPLEQPHLSPIPVPQPQSLPLVTHPTTIVAHVIPPSAPIIAKPALQQQQPITNGPSNAPPPPVATVSPTHEVPKLAAPVQSTNPPVLTNGHEPALQTNGIVVSPTKPESLNENNSSLNSSGDNNTTPMNSNSVTVTIADTPKPTETSTGNMSWASLFSKTKTTNVQTNERRENKVVHNNFNNNNLSNLAEAIHHNKDAKNVMNMNSPKVKSHLAEIGDPTYYQMGEVLVNYTPDNKITSLQPRGLINRSNYCYINSILQAMIACPPMYNLLHALAQNVSAGNNFRKHTQIIDNVVKFVKEFNHLPAAQRVSRRSDKVQKKEQPVAITYDRPFEPNWIYKMLNGIRSDSFVVEGRQEDAEEFLGCLLNGLNDEMLELMKLVGTEIKHPEPISEDGYKSDSDKEWQVIGPKNKGCITRRTEIVRTPISDIFGGHIRSKLHRAGDQITNNIQPFFTLQLNIEKVNSVREALEALVCKNQLEGVTSSKTNEEVEAWQQVTIEELPVVLILHLKCFDFKLDGCTKIIKALEFPVDLKIDSKLLSSKTNYQPKEKQYKLFSVVYHDGKEASKGHYLTDAYHVGYASWLRYDDASVKVVQEDQVLKPHGTRVPYLLFYRRCDTVRNK